MTKRPDIFTWPLRIYWEDTDAGGIVYYANYLKYFERTRTEWLRSLGIEQGVWRERCGAMFVVSQARLRYVRAARLDDELVVSAFPTEIRRVGLTIQQQAWRRTGTERTLLCEASVDVAWVNAITLKPARLPCDLLELLK